ncbi:hypothetical protein E2I00_009924 [Balaenoptera physalus]|uniref:Exocyst complex component 3-like protein 2 n=1 Tax=Balaenoptera physalus TaxID=9770 RepID=A0A643CED4_BALPH|nr:hypothetical protein E2I00_009924 [Balaenoptera physalus]
MPILKGLGVADSKMSRAGTLPLRSSRNPFEEASGLEEEEAGERETLPNGTSCRRRATLEKLAGLAPFRLGRTPGRRAGSPGDGQPRSFLGRVLTPGIRRSSADFGLLARLQGARAHGDEEAAGEAARRLAFLRLGRGPKPRRASLAERVVPAGEAAPEPPPKVPEPPKMKEPLSGESRALAQTRENHGLPSAHLHGHGQPVPAAVLISITKLQPQPRVHPQPNLSLSLSAFNLVPLSNDKQMTNFGLISSNPLPTTPLFPTPTPREVLGLVDMVALENGELGPLLSPGTLRGLEDECVTDVKNPLDGDQWEGGTSPPHHFSSPRTTQLLEEHTERAPRISQDFQQRVERFHENPGVRELLPDTYISRTISLVNCGPPLSKLMRRKWLSSSEALDGIVGTLGAKALALRRMQDEPYQESQASWLDAVVPRLAEVLHLEDTPSIQMEVGMLVRDYPDIRRKHVAALLDIRGLHHTVARHEILAVARDLELSEGGTLSPPRDRAFFADIPVPRPPFCLSLPLFLGRLSLSRLACLPWPRPPSPCSATCTPYRSIRGRQL